MNWNQIGTEVIIMIIGVVVTTIGSIITYLINKLIKDERLKRIANSLNDLVRNSVLTTQQTYVDELKKNNMWDVESQKKALAKSLNLIKTNMSSEVESWLKSNVVDTEDYLKSLIEAQVQAIKK